MPGSGRGTLKDVSDNAMYTQYMCEKVLGLSNEGCALVMQFVGHVVYEAIKADKYEIDVTPVELPPSA